MRRSLLRLGGHSLGSLPESVLKAAGHRLEVAHAAGAGRSPPLRFVVLVKPAVEKKKGKCQHVSFHKK